MLTKLFNSGRLPTTACFRISSIEDNHAEVIGFLKPWNKTIEQHVFNSSFVLVGIMFTRNQYALESYFKKIVSQQ
jgi:hypothetical protein